MGFQKHALLVQLQQFEHSEQKESESRQQMALPCGRTSEDPLC